jgi:diguanylate cyclase (GGDEF)-like protein
MPMMKLETDVLNEEFFGYLIQLEIERALRYQNYVTLFFMEPDTKIEDSKKLEALTMILREEVRVTDVVGRVNHGRSGVILLHADHEGALSACRRVHDRIKDYLFSPDNGFTISIGGSCCPCNTTDFASLTHMAETMLSLAKEQGGNRINFHNGKGGL